ncbi:MAG: anthranilate synthase component I [Persephonella sp.]|nr:MAG: anthranilate synthase component I [Persephonella sp.]
MDGKGNIDNSLSLSFDEFKELVFKNFEKGKSLVIPLFKEVVADTETPLTIFMKIYSPEKFNFLLESVEQKENIGRYSFIGSSDEVYIRGKEDFIEIYNKGSIQYKETRDPLNEIKDFIERYKGISYEGLPPFWGGLIGYLSYNIIYMYEPIHSDKPDNWQLPEFYFFLSNDLIAFDNLSRTIKIISSVKITDEIFEKSKEDESCLKLMYKMTTEKINNIEKKLCKPLKLERQITIKDVLNINLQKWNANVKKEHFINSVERAKRYIEEGDIIQVVLSQRFCKITSAKPVDIYRAMRIINPSPYMFYLDFKDIKLIGSSPEILVSVKNRKILTKPIAGTRPIGKTEEENKKLKEDLLSDEKEKAEHLMLVDLARNDVGKVAKTGTVKVDRFMYIENYSHVMHIVSDVSGELKEDLHPIDVLKAVFPVGTVSGAPKVRAMQIIEELETERRGPYAGAVGYISFDGNLDTAIAIRTAVMKENKIFVQAGAGIVADSIPEREYDETVNKAKALIKAVEIAEKAKEIDC